MGGGAAPSERISAVRLTRKTPESRHKDDGWLGGLLFVPPPHRPPSGVTANKLQEAQRSTGATSAAVKRVEKTRGKSNTCGDQKAMAVKMIIRDKMKPNQRFRLVQGRHNNWTLHLRPKLAFVPSQ